MSKRLIISWLEGCLLGVGSSAATSQKREKWRTPSCFVQRTLSRKSAMTRLRDNRRKVVGEPDVAGIQSPPPSGLNAMGFSLPICNSA